MGLLDSIFGKKEEYPDLDPKSPIAAKVEDYRSQLVDLSQRAKDRLEAVPADDGMYVVVGKPPKEFGVVWYEGHEEHNFAEVVKEKGISGGRIEELSRELKEAYEASTEQPRYSYSLGDQKIVVTPAPKLAGRLDEVVHEVTA